jgi:hypothetical protein
MRYILGSLCLSTSLNWLYERICLRALFVLVAALGVLSMFFSPSAYAAQTRTFTITRPVSYFDGTPFGTEQLVYVVYNAADNKQLFSTTSLVTKRTDIPDGATCFYVRPGVLDVNAQTVIAGSLGDPSPNSCPGPAAKKVGLAGLVVQ